jgi:hypothetical protein
MSEDLRFRQQAWASAPTSSFLLVYSYSSTRSADRGYTESSAGEWICKDYVLTSC